MHTLCCKESPSISPNILEQSSRYQGRIELLEAARGHETTVDGETDLVITSASE